MVGLLEVKVDLKSMIKLYRVFDTGDGGALFRAACRMGLEVIVSKRMNSHYRPVRAPIKCGSRFGTVLLRAF